MHKKERAKRAALAVHLQCLSGVFWVSEKAPKKVTGQNGKRDAVNLSLPVRGALWGVCRIGLQVYKAWGGQACDCKEWGPIFKASFHSLKIVSS